MFIVGEASGDSHAAKLVGAIRKQSPETDFELFGATGKRMREVGVETIVEADQFGISGGPEVAKALPMFWRVFKKLKKEAEMRQPDAVILVDFPDFNIQFAKFCKKNHLKAVYYISPQLWAWRKYRVNAIRKYVDMMLTILPFEKDWYSEMGVNQVTYVGHPLAGEVRPKLTKEEFCKKHGLDSSDSIVTLLAGSRGKEVSRILPELIETAAYMSEKDPSLQFVNALAPNRDATDVEAAITEVKNKGIALPERFVTVNDETHEALGAADVAGVTSGTATLETAIIGTPFAMVYKTSFFNWHAIRPLISVEHFGLVNLIAKKKLVKELIQHDFTATILGEELLRLLTPGENKKMREEFAQIKDSLGRGGASKRAAEAILDLVS